MTRESKRALFLGFSSELVGRLFTKRKERKESFSSSITTWLSAINVLAQSYFRPHKPLPTNIDSNQSRLPKAPCQPFKWAIIDFVIS